MKAHVQIALLALTTAILTTRALFILPTLKVHEISNVPSYFEYVRPANPSDKVKLEVILHSRDIEGLEKALYRVSDPSSPDYGQHLTKQEVNAFFKPTEYSQNIVISWLKSHGIHAESYTSTGIILRFSTSVENANKLFTAEFSEYFNNETGERVIRTASYSLPENLSPFISSVHPTVAFPPHQRKIRRHNRKISILEPLDRSNDTSLDCIGDLFSVSCVGALYGIPQNMTMSSKDPSQLSVFGLGNTVPSPENLTDFIGLYRTDLSALNISYIYMAMDSSSNGVGNVSSPEADLDVEYTVSMTGLLVVYAANSDTSVSAFLTTALNLLDQPHPPSVLSISYGSDEDFVGTPLAISICNAFMALGARGVSILAASGDGGVSGVQYDPECYHFQPTFPASCPFITSVGGTMLSKDYHEVAANLSSGGFSSIFAQPKYQQDSVNQYLKATNNSNSNLYNSTNRAFPDIAAIADNLALVDNEGLDGGDGTSFAAPIVASVIAIINAHRTKSNKPRLGFLNPALYANSSMFFDIIEGSNPGCGTIGFPAIEGWDPVTGLGTPNFAEMLNVLG